MKRKQIGRIIFGIKRVAKCPNVRVEFALGGKGACADFEKPALVRRGLLDLYVFACGKLLGNNSGEFPAPENTCFSVATVVRRLKTGKYAVLSRRLRDAARVRGFKMQAGFHGVGVVDVSFECCLDCGREEMNICWVFFLVLCVPRPIVQCVIKK